MFVSVKYQHMGKRAKIIALMACLLLSVGAVAQSRLERKGSKAYQSQQYVNALRYYKKIKKKSARVNLQLAGCYFHLKKYDLAQRIYKHVDPDEFMAQDLVTYSRVALHNEDYPKALDLIGAAGKAGADPIFVNQRKKQIKWAMDGAKSDDEYDIKAMKIQFSGRSLGLQLSPEGFVYSKMASTSSRKKGKGKKYRQLFSVVIKDGGFSASHRIGKGLSRTHVGGVAITRDGNTMYYTRMDKKSEGFTQMTLHKALKKGTEWKDHGALAFNGKGFCCAWPTLSPDEKDLYFCSNRPGGFGGMDLYVVHRNRKGWSSPENLGPMVNSFENETHPFMDQKRRLWFASKGHVGLGGLDVLYTQKDKKGAFGAPINPGVPVNSTGDDYSYVASSEEAGAGYLISNRGDSKARDRIYRVEKMEYSTLVVVVRDALTNGVITDARVSMVRKRDGEIIARSSKDNDKGEYFFKVTQKEVDKGIVFVVEASKSQYQKRKLEFVPSPQKLSITLPLDPLVVEPEIKFEVQLRPVIYPNRKLIFHNIYFKNNNSNLTLESRRVLDRLVRFLDAYPKVRLKLNAHTDSRGLDALNDKLSQQRALATKKYLVKKGVSAQSIQAKGWGERYLLNGCTDNVPCSPKDHEYNRRLEIIVVL